MGRKEDNVVLNKAKDFAVRIINLYKHLTSTMNEYVLSKQILRSGTSIGANLCEAEEAISKKEFASKVYMALKEARETEYWLELLCRTDYISKKEYDSINADCTELLKLLVSITKTLSSNRSYIGK